MKTQRAYRTTQKVWVSKAGTQIDTESLENLQKTFGGRLYIARGTTGEIIIAAQPQDWEKLCDIMQRGSAPFSEQKVYT